MNPLDWRFPYPSRRSPVLARNVVATSQPLATSAALRVLLDGGNAVDAAVAAAVALTVVEPNSNGLGSDLFAIVADGEGLTGLNASGRSPQGWTPERFAKHTAMPLTGWESVTVPGAVAGWRTLIDDMGSRPFASLFEPALEYAREGFLVSPIVAEAWAGAVERLGRMADWRAAFLPDGRPPLAGEVFRCPGQAKALELIADSGGESFYRGELAERIVAHADMHDAALSAEDLGLHQSEWVEPLRFRAFGVDFHELPPNGQGIAALMALGILERLNADAEPLDSADSVHLQIEAMKLALADVYANVADPEAMHVSPDEMLDPGYLDERARLVDRRRAQPYPAGLPRPSGTVYLTVADDNGLMVSLIQSNFWGFGSGVVVPGTGISMQNRGAGFTLADGHPNQVGPRKRPFHTIIPGMATYGGAPLMSFGVMGGPFQPMGHVQVLARILLHRQNPQAASDAPRWQVFQGLDVGLEAGFDPGVAAELERRGHHVRPSAGGYGGAQIILKTGSGYVAASDHRKDGHAAGF